MTTPQPTDPLFDPDDHVETEPPDLEVFVVKVLSSSLSKRFAVDFGKPWTQAHEGRHQETISALVAAARNKGLSTFKLIAVKPDGRRVEREMSVDRINKNRVLQ